MKKYIIISILTFLAIFRISTFSSGAAGTNMHNATLVKLNETFYGTLNAGETDYYKFILPASGKVKITHYKYRDEYGTYTYNEILNYKGESNGTNWSDDYDENRGYIYGVKSFYLKQGIYYLKSSENSGYYSYNIGWENTNETYAESDEKPLDYLDDAPLIQLGNKITGQVGNFDKQDIFKIYLPTSCTILFNCQEYLSYFDYVSTEILDHNGNYLFSMTEDEALPNTPYYTITDEIVLKAGTYYIKIACTYSLTGEKYTFELNEKPITVGKTSIKGIKRSGKKAIITVGKVSGASGYQVVYSTAKDFRKSKTKTVNSTKTKINIKKLKNKRYYIKVRAYKKANGRTYYGSFSRVKKIKKK